MSLRDPGPLSFAGSIAPSTTDAARLVGLEFDVATAVGMRTTARPSFDNFAEALNVSPVLMRSTSPGPTSSAELFRVPTDDKRRAEHRAISPGSWSSGPAGASAGSRARFIAGRSFLPRAFRRPVTTAEVGRYVKLFEIESAA